VEKNRRLELPPSLSAHTPYVRAPITLQQGHPSHVCSGVLGQERGPGAGGELWLLSPHNEEVSRQHATATPQEVAVMFLLHLD
jgi:hypothetical protein